MLKQPNFFFIGGMRCGSTSLNLMLEQHPEIFMSPVKEPYYFLAEALRNTEGQSPEDMALLEALESGGNYRTKEKYQALFQDATTEKIIGEASHYIYHPWTAPVIHKHCPEARILVCLRNPIDRLFSEYLLVLRDGKEKGSFAGYVARYVSDYLHGQITEKAYVPKLNKGLQAGLLAPWIDHFGRDRIKLVLFDDLNRSPTETMTDVFRWLDVDESFTVQKIHAQRGGAVKAKWVTGVMNSRHGLLKQVKSLMPKSAKEKLRSLIFSKTLERPEMEVETQELLVQFYRDDMERLSGILGKDLSAWSQPR